MSVEKKEALVTVLAERFTTIRLPRILDIKEKVEKGGTLNDSDVEFFEEVFADTRKNKSIIEGDKELEGLVAKAIHLNKEIMDLALENEKKAQ
jgi:hypothetical protein